MKKLLALVLVLILTLGLTACGTTGTEKGSKKQKNDKTPIESVITNKDDETEVEDITDIDEDVSDTKTEEPEKVGNDENIVPEPEKPEEPSNPTETPEPETTVQNVYFNENNNYYDANTITIRPRYVYWENGELVAECFVINGFSYNVFNMNVKFLSFSNTSGLVASGDNFGVLSNLTLEPYTYAIHTFRFGGAAVDNYGADLSYLNCKSNIFYSY